MTHRFCTACGAPLETASHFCTSCGQPSEPVAEPSSTPTGPEAAGAAPLPPPPVAPTAPPLTPPPPGSLPASSGDASNRKRSMVIIGVLAALLVLVAVVAVVSLTGDEAGADVALEPTGVEVPDPFTSTVAIDEDPLSATTTTAATTSGPASTTTSPRPGAAGGVVAGSAPGLYGGTRDAAACDPEKMIVFLQSDAEKAKAWADVQDIEVSQIPTFTRGLTPVVLRRDTRVLNHGYRNGTATPRPAVLQAGTAVLVDDFGIPRVKCGCGNPLAEPEPITTSTRYTGTKWTGFRPANVVAVSQDIEVDVFVLVDVRTGEPFHRPTGSKGDDDTDATSPTSPTTTTTKPEATTTTTKPETTTTASGGSSEGTSAPVLFEISSIAGVSNGPTAPSVAVLPASRITAISTYHWNNATGAAPGTIGLRGEDGTLYGPFPATGSPGQGGVPNALWTAVTDFEVPAGTYTVVDSSPGTWAWAPDTGGRGMVTIYGR